MGTFINLVWWFLNVSTTCSTFLPATLLSVNFQSCIFHPCTFVRHFPVLQIQRPLLNQFFCCRLILTAIIYLLVVCSPGGCRWHGDCHTAGFFSVQLIIYNGAHQSRSPDLVWTPIWLPGSALYTQRITPAHPVCDRNNRLVMGGST